MRTIDRETLKDLLDRDAVTVAEALPLEYFRKAHLPGALHLPHDEVAALAPSLLPDRRAAIVLYCASGECKNSRIAAAALEALGYGDVRVYVEGKVDWIAAGYLTPAVTRESSSRRPSSPASPAARSSSRH